MLSDKKWQHASSIKQWALDVPATMKPTLKALSSATKPDIPLLTSGTSDSSTPSVLTDNVKVISHQASQLVTLQILDFHTFLHHSLLATYFLNFTQ